jgi:sigma-B regulation protein RsbU (phosphoserine phosphatase)
MSSITTTHASVDHLQQDTLRRLLAVARHLSASADLREILSLIIDAMRDILGAERATVFEFDAAAQELFTMVAHGVGGEAAREIRIPMTTGLAGQSATTRQIINVPDAYADARFNQAVDRQTGFRTRSILAVPLLGHDGELVGVAQVLNKRGGPFTQADEEIAQALAAQAAVAMKRGRLIEDRLVRLKLESDLELARKIQQASFPSALPDITGFDVAVWNQPADETGGDVYDAIDVPHPDGTPTQRAMLLMADATGHGVGPAISVTQLCSMVRMAVRLGATLDDVVRHVNQQLTTDLPSGRFITAWFGLLDGPAGTITSFSAGQAPLLHYSAHDDRFEEMGADTIPFGVLLDIESQVPPAITMHAGDVFAVISDGFFEAHQPGGDLFGTQRICQCIRTHREQSSAQVISALRMAVDEFTHNAQPHDDRTAIIIRCVRAGFGSVPGGGRAGV